MTSEDLARVEDERAQDLSPEVNAPDAQAPSPQTTETTDNPPEIEAPRELEGAERLFMLKKEIAYFDGRLARRLPPDDPEFNPYIDCDRLLGAGTVVMIGGVPCELLDDAPIRSVTFQDEAVFVEHLVQHPSNLAMNAAGLRQRYNQNGAMIGRNDDHPYNRLADEIARLEAELAEAELAKES